MRTQGSLILNFFKLEQEVQFFPKTLEPEVPEKSNDHPTLV